MPPRAVRAPGHVRARLHRQLRQRAVRARPHERAARRERRRRLRDLARHVLRVAREQDHREAERHHDQRAGEHPVGQTLRVDEQPRDDRDDDERRRVDRHRAQEQPRPSANGIAIAGAVQSVATASSCRSTLVRVRRPLVGILRETRITSAASAAGQSGRSSAHRRAASRSCAPRAACAACRPCERRLAGEQLVRHAAERVDVGAMVGVAGRPPPAPAPCTPACRSRCRAA